MSYGWRTRAIALAALLFAGLAARDALVFVLQSDAPEAALRLDQGNPVALVRHAETQIAAGDPAMTSARLAAITRQAIRRLALNAPAFRLSGMVQTQKGDLGRISEHMAMASMLSRRDVSTQFFMIEDAVRRNDVAGALAAYDNALRVEESSRTILYPVLTEAMREPLIRQRFVRYVRMQPPWLESFLRFAVSNATEPSSIAELAFASHGFPKARAYSSLDTELLSVLVAKGEYPMAFRYYRSLKNARPAVLRSLAMDDPDTDPAFAPITWQPYSLAGIDASWVAETKDNIDLQATLDAGYVGPVARKILALAPGTYHLAAPFRSDSTQPGQTLSWKIDCAAGATPLNSSVPLGEQGTLAVQFTLPAGCNAQTATISVATPPGTNSIGLVMMSPRLTRSR